MCASDRSLSAERPPCFFMKIELFSLPLHSLPMRSLPMRSLPLLLGFLLVALLPFGFHCFSLHFQCEFARCRVLPAACCAVAITVCSLNTMTVWRNPRAISKKFETLFERSPNALDRSRLPLFGRILSVQVAKTRALWLD